MEEDRESSDWTSGALIDQKDSLKSEWKKICSLSDLFSLSRLSVLFWNASDEFLMVNGLHRGAEEDDSN